MSQPVSRVWRPAPRRRVATRQQKRVSRFRVKTGFRILHSLRAPVGGLFRHVCDLATAQSRAGHEVAVVCAESGDALTCAHLDDLSATISLGVHRIAMGRDIGFSDVGATRRTYHLAKTLAVDVVHGHGAKGGAYARLASRALRVSAQAPLCFYTPHGGSLHVGAASLKGRALMAIERRLEAMTDGLIFESAFSAKRYADVIRQPCMLSRVIPNGVGPADFEAIPLDGDATDLLFIGELRLLKGVDVLLDALALVNRRRPTTLTIVGSGPDAERFSAQSAALGLNARVRFVGAHPARAAFKMGRMLIAPSRAESFPYILLEAGAQARPLITTNVGGIPEIIGDSGTPMLAAGNAAALATALFDQLGAPDASLRRAAALQARIARLFTIETMADAVNDFYIDTAAQRSQVAAKGARRLLLSS